MATHSVDKYDIGIVNTDNVNVGMMLAKDRGTPIYQEFDDEYLATQFFTGEAGYGSVRADRELPLRQDSWRSGISHDVYDPSTPEGYYKSKGMDLRFKGMAIAGYGATTVSKPVPASTAANFVNLNCELTTDWVGGYRTGTPRTGTYSWLTNTTQPIASLVIKNWATNYQGKTFGLMAHIRADAASSINVGLYDGLSNTYTRFDLAAGGTWYPIIVNKTLNVSASTLEVLFERNTAGSAYFDDGQIFTPLVSSPVAFTEYDNNLYAGFGNTLGKLHTAGDAFNTVALVGSITDLRASPDENLYICSNYGSALATMINTADTISLPTGAPAVANAFQFMQVVHSATPTMWGNTLGHQIRSTTTPNNALSWSGVTNVSSSFDNITDLVSYGGALYIMKEDKPYYLDSTGAVQDDLAQELESLKAATSGKNAHVWKGKLYIPCGTQGLLETDGTTNGFLNPALYCTTTADYVGSIMAVASDEEYLFVAIDNGTEVEILAGREETIGAVTAWIWHPIAELTLAGVETMFVSTVYQKRLWIASTSASDSLYYIPLPTGYGNIETDANRSFLSNTFFETSFLHGNFRDIPKAFTELSVLMGHTYDADIFFQAYYKTLSNSTYTFIANYKGSSTSMLQTNYLPDAGANHPVDQMARLKFITNTDDATKTPKMLGYNLKGLLAQPRGKTIACTVLCADELLLKDGNIDRGSPERIKATIEELHKATWPVKVYDIDGNLRNVRSLPLPSGTPRKSLHVSEMNRKKEWWYNLLLQEVDLA